jgi:hypothetical protein
MLSRNFEPAADQKESGEQQLFSQFLAKSRPRFQLGPGRHKRKVTNNGWTRFFTSGNMENG